MIEQWDGELIPAAACTCPELYTVYPWHGSMNCPIDRHRVAWFQSQWEFDDNATTIETDVALEEADPVELSDLTGGHVDVLSRCGKAQAVATSVRARRNRPRRKA